MQLHPQGTVQLLSVLLIKQEQTFEDDIILGRLTSGIPICLVYNNTYYFIYKTNQHSHDRCVNAGLSFLIRLCDFQKVYLSFTLFYKTFRVPDTSHYQYNETVAPPFAPLDTGDALSSSGRFISLFLHRKRDINVPGSISLSSHYNLLV